MSDDLMLMLLGRIREDLSETKMNVVEIKEILGLLEGQYASVSRRLDRLSGDVERIKIRLDLAEEV